MGHIVVGVDETPQAAAALRWASEEAATRAWRITAVLAWDLLSQHHPDPAASFDPHYTAADAEAALDAIVERTLAPERAANIERRVVCDVPSHALIDAACDADLLVLGNRDRHGIRAVLAAPVSSRIRRHPPCPIVIVHRNGSTETLDTTGANEPARPTRSSRRRRRLTPGL
jgi:nucleotide-binding universal stress UspA family protein